ncbi:PDR/VanB family oxidoreductase [Acinetobacter nectaris]|uniref:PDR/VanB family oxidoreductase n=1 Tax=Acinetobacter nectaris TaxID=1219382 RepID=UPI001F461CA3|nr:PDR/VanB family oxidoreductase [Acinetobacter nectaris]MCF8998382.1 oxidoreductase [Acinetobacter nectaris]MCF9028423.1 oxidoreductase [Acinetobacter nectaris]
MEKITVIVKSMSLQGDGNIEVVFKAKDKVILPRWEAGAHIDVYLTSMLIRQYSLVGSPSDEQHYTICVKKESNSRGGSQFIHDTLRVGHELTISLPRNHFQLAPSDEYCLVAGGIGITPILTMAEYLEQSQKKFKLFYYVKTIEQVAFLERLKRDFQYGTIQIIETVQGKGIRNTFPNSLKQPQKESQLYLCGPQGFMDVCIEKSIQHGWSNEQIFFEAFAPVKTNIAVTSDDGFQVRLSSTGETFDVPKDKTIATVLIENNINVPISCEMGMCGACLTQVVCGEVDHQDTVQSDEEKQANEQYIALCCSRAKSKVLEINL